MLVWNASPGGDLPVQRLNAREEAPNFLVAQQPRYFRDRQLPICKIAPGEMPSFQILKHPGKAQPFKRQPARQSSPADPQARRYFAHHRLAVRQQGNNGTF